MRLNSQIIGKNPGAATLLLFALTLGIQPAQAQSPDRQREIQQLKEKLQQLDQMMGEVRTELNTLEREGQPSNLSPSPAPVPAAAAAPAAAAPVKKESESTFNVYGFVMLDSGYNFGQIDPNWFL